MAAKSEPVTYRFVARRGVHFSEDGADAWAHFTRDRSADAKGVPGYSFETRDAAVAKRLRAVNDYGIAEVGAAPNAGE